MNEMSQREQKLVLFLGIFAIAALFLRFILFPSLDTISSLDAQVSEAQVKKSEIVMKIGSMDKMQANLETLATKYADATSSFFPMLTNQEIGHKLTTMVESNGSQIADIRITSPQSPITLQPYVGSELYQQVQQAIQDQQNQTSGTAATDATTTDPTAADQGTTSATNQIAAMNETASAIQDTPAQNVASGATSDIANITAADLIHEAAVTLIVNGSTAGIEALLDQLEAESSIKVLSWRSEIRGQNGTNVQRTQINLMVYMCEKQT